jgi:sugar O-acyltransferase (sialic acid O-acetyltransferase NeuD family)
MISARRPMGDTTRELCLLGTGTFATEVAEWAQDAGWTIAGLVELRDASRVGGLVSGWSVLAPDAIAPGAQVLIAAGGDRQGHRPRLRAAGWRAATVVHPRAHVSPSARLGPGCIVAPGAVVGAETVIGEHTLVSRGALVGHHVQVGGFVSLFPGSNVGGNVTVGDAVSIGIGAVVVNAISVGEGATVAAGAVVVRPIPERARVQGVPAREYRP